jgi:HK97 family phage major capsid protein
MNDMPDVAANTLSYAYANFSMGYTIVDRTGFRVIRDEVTNKPNVLFYTTKRTGGDVTNYESIKILKGGA